MSTVEDAPHPVEDTPRKDELPADEPASPSRPLARRPWIRIAAAAATLAAVAGAIGIWEVRHREIPPTTPITLPPTVGGLPLLTRNNAYASPAWQLKARTAAAGTAYDAKVYGEGPTTRSIRVVAARTDLTGKLDQAWAADLGRKIGSARCTHHTKLTPSGQPKDRPTVLVCWRTSATLSVYSVIIDPKATTPVPDADGVSAVDVAWKAARTRR